MQRTYVNSNVRLIPFFSLLLPSSHPRHRFTPRLKPRAAGSGLYGRTIYKVRSAWNRETQLHLPSRFLSPYLNRPH